MWSKKWYLKRNVSRDVHLLNELLETDVQDHINYLRMNKTVGFPEWTAQFSVWKATGQDSSEACAVAWQHFTQFFPQVWRHTVKSLSLTESV